MVEDPQEWLAAPLHIVQVDHEKLSGVDVLEVRHPAPMA